jgi:hypothetical protein
MLVRHEVFAVGASARTLPSQSLKNNNLPLQGNGGLDPLESVLCIRAVQLFVYEFYFPGGCCDRSSELLRLSIGNRGELGVLWLTLFFKLFRPLN